MLTAGLDMGAKTTKVAILGQDNPAVLGKAIVLTGFEQEQTATTALTQALAQAGIARSDLAGIVATGAGRKMVPWITRNVTEVSAGARAIAWLDPRVRTLVDVGAEEVRVIRCTPGGQVADFVVNEKCAAGAGTFVEAMARALELTLDEMGPLSLESTRVVPMNAQCTVFAESEVVSLIHARTPRADIVRAVHDAIASRVGSMVRRIGMEVGVALVGGLARNAGFVVALERALEVEVHVPGDPEYVGALGAALIARQSGG